MRNNRKMKNLKNLIACIVYISISLAAGILFAKTPDRVLSVEDISEYGQEFMMNTLQWDLNRVEMQVVYEGKDIKVPTEGMTFDCKLPGSKKRIGRVHFMCFIKIDGIKKKNLRLHADIKVSYDVYKSIHSLKAGHIIKDSDVQIERIKSDQILRNVASDPREIIGHRLMMNLNEGQHVQTHMLRKVPIVKNGDRILLIAQKGPLRVTVPGVVKENGFKDDTIRVENIQSKKIIYGTVVDSRTVKINF